MHFTVETLQARVPVTILGLHGNLDASNFEEAIAKTRDLYNAGTRYLLLDLSDMPFMGSSGLVALHSIVLLMGSEEPPDPEFGWQAFHDIDRSSDAGPSQFVKLLSPHPKVERTLRIAGMIDVFEVHTDREAAIAAF